MMIRVSVTNTDYYTEEAPIKYMKKLGDTLGLKFNWSRKVLGQVVHVRLKEDSISTFPVPDVGSYLKWLCEQFDRELIVTYDKGILNILIDDGDRDGSNDKM